ncbi:6198_t:CDS:2 [Entrophospora sp. SA101]|nr:4983_t:CDS:2 [Entrophospora sp. SA101]CAJ0827988.1 3686_t:CDS:2 [Entrophospora sp. SA101]CAJ0881523.1 6198_t:CDS:2 [Entrophospora sp. SA101]
MTGKIFSSINEELAYYKTHASNLEQTLLDTQSSMEEFQSSSRELEEELERELEQSERRYVDIKAKNEMLKNEVDQWKQKYYQARSEANVTQQQMQRELDSLRKVEKTYAIKTRELELDNDDLERTERAAKCSLQDLENKYNKAIERNAILENELEGKNILIVQVQRLKDELRDVNIELAILKNKQDGEYGPPPPSASQLYSIHKTELSRSPSHMSVDSNSSDVSPNPVKMVQEMVGRVKSLEARLVSCRSLVTPLLAPPPSYSTTMPLQNGINSPPLSPKTSRLDSPYITSLKEKRRSSVQKTKFSIPPTPIRANSFGKA